MEAESQRTRDRQQEGGYRRQKTGDRRQEVEDRREEKGDKGQDIYNIDVKDWMSVCGKNIHLRTIKSTHIYVRCMNV